MYDQRTAFDEDDVVQESVGSDIGSSADRRNEVEISSCHINNAKDVVVSFG